MPGAPFRERHDRVIDASPARVWDALLALRWGDLRLTAPLLVVRGLAAPRAGRRSVLREGPVVAVQVEPEVRWVGVRIGQPWRPVPTLAPDPAGLEELRAFGEPGWLKFGMEFVLQPLADGRTVLTTTTLCEATDQAAHRKFARYWRLIEPFSGLIRIDMLAAVARRCRGA
ncbi:MAG: hypothetical protein QM582_17630 [Micropruina sp.]|uniref:hypothetical protein n=1 Tax=Micropruina sp. TaxID=2737536 RepID=UPI0039E6FFE2